MSVIKWAPLVDPFEEMDRMMSDFSPAFGATRSGLIPAIDVYEKGDSIVVEASLPGIDTDKVDVAVENDVLTIEGKEEKKTEVDEKNYYRREVRSGSFHRAVQLPTAVQGDKAEAQYENGVLKVVIPKQERIKPKQVKIAVKK